MSQSDTFPTFSVKNEKIVKRGFINLNPYGGHEQNSRKINLRFFRAVVPNHILKHQIEDNVTDWWMKRGFPASFVLHSFSPGLAFRFVSL